MLIHNIGMVNYKWISTMELVLLELRFVVRWKVLMFVIRSCFF